MTPSSDARFRGGRIFAIVAILSVAFATPWAAPFRESARPLLREVVVIFETLAGAWYLVAALMEGVSRKGGWSGATIPLALGLSSLCVAFIYLPGGSSGAQRDIPLVGAVLFALIGVALLARAPERSGSARESSGQ